MRREGQWLVAFMKQCVHRKAAIFIAPGVWFFIYGYVHLKAVDFQDFNSVQNSFMNYGFVYVQYIL